MAFDGITVHALVNELNEKLKGGRIDKIAQPEKDELLITIKANKEQLRLMLSVSGGLPLAYITSTNKPSPLQAPGFCMLLRKHINGGRIVAVSEPGLERIIDIKIEHLNEMGDLCTKHLIVELMGKHSNIIFIDDNNKIIDSIKRINASVSSFREVLPGLDYFIPETVKKSDLLTASADEIKNILAATALPVSKGLYSLFTGISPKIADEICLEADIEGNAILSDLSDIEILHLSNTLYNFMDDVKNCNFIPAICYDSNKPVDYIVTKSELYKGLSVVNMDSVSAMLEKFYAAKNITDRIRERSADLRQIINTALERNYKKYDLQQKQLKDTEKRDKYMLYGELLNVYGYSIEEGRKSVEVLNYYTNENITIPLDENLTAKENSQKYYQKYNKLKRTYEALSDLILQTKAEIDHLESISTAIDIARDYDDLTEIREEMISYGFIKKHGSAKGKEKKVKSKPFHYISSDGFDIFVGKNNLQNEELTFKLAVGNDWWFHAKGMPGSHVIVKNGGAEIADSTFEEAAALAAYYSKGRDQEKVEIDYVEKKQVKKVAGAAPGFVIYHTNYSMNIAPDISNIKEAN